MEAACQAPRVLSPNKANTGELLTMVFIESWLGNKNSVYCQSQCKPAIA